MFCYFWWCCIADADVADADADQCFVWWWCCIADADVADADIDECSDTSNLVVVL